MDVKPGGDNGCFDRVEHIEARLDITKAVPGVFVVDNPVIAVTQALVSPLLWAPDLEPPVIFKLVSHLAHCAAEVDRLEQRLLNQCLTTRRLHHRRRHVTAGDNRVLRAGG